MTLEDLNPESPVTVFPPGPERLSLLQRMFALLAILALLPVVLLIGLFSCAAQLDHLTHRLMTGARRNRR